MGDDRNSPTASLHGATAHCGLLVNGALDDLDRLIRELGTRPGIKLVYVRVSLSRLKISPDGPAPTEPTEVGR